MLNEIKWPEKFMPGTTDNYVSNEVIVKGITAKEAWEFIVNTSKWEGYYENVGEVKFYDGEFPYLAADTRFQFKTFEFIVEAKVLEFVAPSGNTPGRIAWNGWQNDGDERVLDVYHAFLFEDLPNGRVRILTQETQNGAPAVEMANEKPNPMLNAHQDWLDGIISAVKLSNQSK